jgi:hypothetical protein
MAEGNEMSTQETGQPSSPSAGGGDRPYCPQCQRRMIVKQVSPVLFASDFDDIVFGCDECGTEAKRSVKRR